MNLKKHWMQTLTLALCILLLGVTIRQGRQIEALRSDLWSSHHDLERSISVMDETVDRIARELEANKLVQSWELRPAGIDGDTLQGEFGLTLRAWQEDTEAFFDLSPGSDRTRLTNHGDGTFSAPVRVSLKAADMRLQTYGTNFRETLGYFEDVSALLPVQMNASGTDTPRYQDGVFSARSWPDAHLRGPDGNPAEVSKAELRLYRNDHLELTRTAVYDPETQCFLSGLGTEDPWEIECQQGDAVRMDFYCRDKYGLGYTFALYDWTAGSDTLSGEQAGAQGTSGSMKPVLSWD